jgi:predicted dehydrogenase
MIKIGLIGAGFMGCTHLAAYELLLSSGKFKVTAIADTNENAQKFAQRLGAKLYADGDELLNNADVNTVDICLPTYLHFNYAKKALEKGFNIFVEKPLCRTYAEARQIAELAEQKGALAMVGQCIRFWDEYVYLKEIYDKKTYGALKNAVFSRLSPRPTWSWQNWLMDNNKSGGAALDLHVHDSDFLLYLFGAPKKIKSVVNKSGETDSYILSAYDYDGFTVTAEGTWDLPASYPFEMYYRAVFEKAVVEYSSVSGIKVYADDASFVPELKKACTASGETSGNISDLGGYYNELSYFIDCLHEGKNPDRATLFDGAQSVAFIEKELSSKNAD